LELYDQVEWNRTSPSTALCQTTAREGPQRTGPLRGRRKRPVRCGHGHDGGEPWRGRRSPRDSARGHRPRRGALNQRLQPSPKHNGDLRLVEATTFGDVHPSSTAPRRGGSSIVVLGSPGEELLEIDGREVRVTSPEKVFFSESGETKLDLVGHYVRL